ncbi:MAG: acylneuraminate cytidylyltransferase family protein [Gammaproteobacteria bacterium]|nr:acylneuraminate cytidylyltransferase family protein [Gammaproteobacteria bacterium]
MSCCAFIFARGGSKGVKRKNIRSFAGKPLIAHTIEFGLKHPGIDRLIVSTEDQEIAEVALQFGAEVPFMRPQALAEDDSSEWQAWQHAIKEIQKQNPFNQFVCLPVTAPLRKAEDLTQCLKVFRKGQADLVFTARQAQRNPYFNMVTVNQQGYAELAISSAEIIEQRQAAPAVYDMATVAYVTSPNFVLQHDGIFSGRCQFVCVPAERAVDVDTELDFKIAEYLFKENCHEPICA